MIDPRRPEEAVGFAPEAVASMLDEAGMTLHEPHHPGQWANHPAGLTLQDIVIARRPTG